MAVYTHVALDEARALIDRYAIGALRALEGIQQGVENTNYLVVTDRGKFVLTLFEKRVSESDLPFFIGLMEHLAARGVPAPQFLRDRTGAVLQTVAGRKAALATFLPGAQRMAPTAEDCRQLGEALARLHIAAGDYASTRRNALGPEGWRRLAAQIGSSADRCEPGLASLIVEELEFVRSKWPTSLPSGVIHADLFPDNVFFEGDRVSGLIDFYFACNDFLAYDIAVCLNSWSNVDGGWSHANARALIDGYENVRPLSTGETQALPTLLRGAALRFLLTRLADFVNQVEGALVEVKDPLEYADLLAFHSGEGAASFSGSSDA